jgi:L-lactate dehydrogenase complex protein LldG
MAASSREQILQSLHDCSLEDVDLPDLNRDWTTYEDRVQQFAKILEGVGGRAVIVRNVEEIHQELERMPAYAASRKVCSLVGGIGRATVDLERVADPHQLEDVEFFIARGEFGVAENAAVWVTDAATKHRVLYFLTQHLALVVPADQIIDNMHQAYERLAFGSPRFGLFISGPSKTADIEQSLVIGAHGARSMTVFVMRNA